MSERLTEWTWDDAGYWRRGDGAAIKNKGDRLWKVIHAMSGTRRIRCLEGTYIDGEDPRPEYDAWMPVRKWPAVTL